jgi:hypothetical protein
VDAHQRCEWPVALPWSRFGPRPPRPVPARAALGASPPAQAVRAVVGRHQEQGWRRLPVSVPAGGCNFLSGFDPRGGHRSTRLFAGQLRAAAGRPPWSAAAAQAAPRARRGRF